MAQASMTTITALLKELYEGRLQNQMENEKVVSKRIESTSRGVTETVGGKYVDFPIKVGRNSGVGSRFENEALPTAGSQRYNEVHVPLTTSYGVFRVTGHMMELAETNAQAFASGMQEEMDGLKEDSAYDYERQSVGTGTGLLATVTADGANTVTVDNIQYLFVGMVIDARVKVTGAISGADSREITAINKVTRVVTYSGADAAVVADGTVGLYREDNFVGANARELSGIEKIADDATLFHNVDPATEPVWQPSILANAGTNRPLAEGLMIQLVDDIRVNGGGNDVSVIFTGLGVRRAYFDLLVQQRRQVNTKEFAGGFTGLPFNHGKEIPIVDCLSLLPNRMIALSESKIKRYRNQDWHFGRGDGTILKWVSGFDAYQGFLKIHSEYGTNQRNAHGTLKDLIEG
jgi:hypothetical protein